MCVRVHMRACAHVCAFVHLCVARGVCACVARIVRILDHQVRTGQGEAPWAAVFFTQGSHELV